MQNAFIESFYGPFRDDCLNQPWFASLAEAKLLAALRLALRKAAACTQI
jgi:hypothetical protein